MDLTFLALLLLLRLGFAVFVLVVFLQVNSTISRTMLQNYITN
jgi:hypothetical protein